jgi:thioredoxin
MMRKTFLILLAVVGITSACSSTTGKQNPEKTNVSVVSETGKPIHITYDEFLKKVWNFEESPQKWIFKGDLPVIIDFYADWCKPCKMIAPIMEKLASDNEGKLIVYKINVDNERKLASVFQVQSIPSVLFVPVKGEPSMQTGALSEEAYLKIVKEQLLVK